jgi:hypothetical protein
MPTKTAKKKSANKSNTEKEVHRYQLDIIVVADSRDDADRAVTIRGPHILRVLKWSVIRDAHGTNPAWKVTEKGSIMTVLLKRDLRPKTGMP